MKLEAAELGIQYTACEKISSSQKLSFGQLLQKHMTLIPQHSKSVILTTDPTKKTSKILWPNNVNCQKWMFSFQCSILLGRGGEKKKKKEVFQKTAQVCMQSYSSAKTVPGPYTSKGSVSSEAIFSLAAKEHPV